MRQRSNLLSLVPINASVQPEKKICSPLYIKNKVKKKKNPIVDALKTNTITQKFLLAKKKICVVITEKEKEKVFSWKFGAVETI